MDDTLQHRFAMVAVLRLSKDATGRDGTRRTDDSIDSLCYSHFLGVGNGEKQGDIRVCGTMAGYVEQSIFGHGHSGAYPRDKTIRCRRGTLMTATCWCPRNNSPQV